MRIGIDIDDTLTLIRDDLLMAAIKYDKSLGGNGIPVNNGEYYIGRKFNWSKDNYRYFMSTVRRDVVNNAKLRDGVIEVLTKLKENGNKIIFLTARSDIYYHNPLKMTVEWLKKENIPYDKLILPSLNKKRDCLNEKIDIFIDDDINNCLSVKKLGIKVLLMDNFDNYLNDKEITRIYNFYDVLREIDSFIKK